MHLLFDTVLKAPGHFPFSRNPHELGQILNAKIKVWLEKGKKIWVKSKNSEKLYKI